METISGTPSSDVTAIHYKSVMNSGQNQKILVVDDELEIVELLRYNLLSRQYDVITAANGEDALKMAVRELPDLILLDYMLPGLSGPDIARLLQDLPETMDIPIIFLTARSDSDSIVKGFRTGANDYVTKPFQLAELVARIETQLKLKTTRDKLEQTQLELKKANASKDRFFSIFIHDIRSPIHALSGFIQFLNKRYDRFSDTERKDILNTCQSNVNQIHLLLMKILQWCQLQIGMFEYRPSLISLSEITQKVITFFDAQIKEKELLILTDIDDTARVFADPGMVDSIVRNLIQNAIRFTPNDGKITIQSERQNEYERITICDTGIGMDSETLRGLFNIETQVSTDDLAGDKGAGLGLVLCRELVDLNGGTITATSEPMVGTCVTLRLPRHTSHSESKE